MKIVDRFLNLFSKRRQLMLGAMAQPTNLMDYVYKARADAFQRITGKQLPTRVASIKTEQPQDLKGNLSPARRLSRRSD